MVDETPDWMLRRTTDYQFVDHIYKLESRVESLEKTDQHISDEVDALREMIRETAESVKKITDGQLAYQPTLQSIERIMGAGLVLRWVVLFVVGTLAAVGTVATAWETIRGWLR